MRTTLAILAAALLAASCGGGSDDAPTVLDDGPDVASGPAADPTSNPASNGAADNPMATVDGAGGLPTGAGEPDDGATPAGDDAAPAEPAPSVEPVGDADPAGVGETAGEPAASSTLPTPSYRGTLSFADVRAVDLGPFLAEEGLRDVNVTPSLARDGDRARLDVTDETGRIVAVATVDTTTGAPSWVTTDMSPDTVVLFDADDAPVAVAGLGCRPATYEKRFDGAAVRTAGAVLWDTAAGTWQPRGARADLRGCTPTDRVSCVPPYAYAMSYDGDVQYAEVPTDRPYDAEGAYFRPFVTVVERARTDAPAPETLPELENATGLVTNRDGSLLLVDNLRASDAVPEGFKLYRPDTGEHVSLNRALNACPDADEAGAAVPAEDCRFTSVPRSITNDPATFTAEGTSVIIRSVSRIDGNFEQEVEAMLIDVDTGATWSMPRNLSSDPASIGADASVFLGTGDAPGYDLLIGRR